MNLRRVVITGTGIVSAIGQTVADFWRAAQAGTTRVEPIPPAWQVYHPSRSRYWSPLGQPDYASAELKRADLIRHDPVVLIAIIAAEQAVRAAGLPRVSIDPKNSQFAIPGYNSVRSGVYVGTTLGGVCSPMNNHYPHLLSALRGELEQLGKGGHPLAQELALALHQFPRVSPLVAPQAMPNAIPAALSIRYGFQGPSQAIGIACASGTAALGAAFNAIRSGQLDMVIAGGAEHLGDRAGAYFMGFDRLSTLAHADLPAARINRPFDRRHSGFLYSEGGAGMLVLETAQRAAQRGVTPLAEITGYGETCDALSMVAMREDNAMTRHAILQALQQAGVTPADVDYVNAHGTGTTGNDGTESRLLMELFGRGPVVNTTKSLLGHTIGACGAIEAIVCALTLRDGIAHPSLNLDDPICDLDFARALVQRDFKVAVSPNYGFGGHNAALVIQRWDS